MAQSTHEIQGAWELVSYDYGQGNKNADAKTKQIKLITANHFIWVVYDTAKKELLASGGGTYKLQSPSYVEHIDFTDKSNIALTGKDQSFKIRLDGDTMQISGVLSQGMKIAETWKRSDLQ